MLQVFYSAKSADSHSAAACRTYDSIIEGFNELGIRQLSTLPYILTAAEEVMEDGKKKFKPTEEELNPPTRLLENRVINYLANNLDFKRYAKDYVIDWTFEKNRFKRIFIEFRKLDIYKEYVSAESYSFDDDKNIALKLFKTIINDEGLREVFFDHNIMWEDDFDQIAQYIYNQLKGLTDDIDEATPLFTVCDSRVAADAEALEFSRQLLNNAQQHYDEYVELIKAHLKGWDFERVALIDVLILTLAITEFINCPSIPERVTINEYIELSKEFSTDRSKLFVNGILDRILVRLRSNGQIHKSGRGLFNPKSAGSDD